MGHCREFLLNASVAEVEQKVAKVLEVMKPAGGYILRVSGPQRTRKRGS